MKPHATVVLSAILSAAPLLRAQSGGSWAVFTHGIHQTFGTFAGDRHGTSSAVVDWNADGRDDLAIGGNGYLEVRNGPNGRVLDRVTGPGRTGFGVGCAAGDFDGNGVPDLAVLSSYDGGVSILWNRSTSSPTGFPTFVGNTNIREIVACDVDGDGRDEVVVSDPLAQVNGVSAAGRVVAWDAVAGQVVASIDGSIQTGRLGAQLASAPAPSPQYAAFLLTSQPGALGGQGEILQLAKAAGTFQVANSWTVPTTNGSLGSRALVTDGVRTVVGSTDNVAVLDHPTGTWPLNLDSAQSGDGRGDSVGIVSSTEILFTDLAFDSAGDLFLADLAQTPPAVTPLASGAPGTILRVLAGDVSPAHDGVRCFVVGQTGARNPANQTAAGAVTVFATRRPRTMQLGTTRFRPGTTVPIDFRGANPGDAIVPLFGVSGEAPFPLGGGITLAMQPDPLTSLSTALLGPGAIAGPNGEAGVVVTLPNFFVPVELDLWLGCVCVGPGGISAASPHAVGAFLSR